MEDFKASGSQTDDRSNVENSNEACSKASGLLLVSAGWTALAISALIVDPAMAAESLDEAEQLQTCGNDARSREGFGVWSVFALETDHLANSEK